MRILVLGCGEMGQEAIRDLHQYGELDEIVVGARNPDRALSVLSDLRGPRQVRVERIDIGNCEALVSLMAACDVVLNCIGPNYKHEVSIARAAIRARRNLVDINDDYETTFEMLALDAEAKDAGVSIVLGLGASPGINNVLVRAAANQLDEVLEIDTAWVMSGADPGGLALSYHLLHSLSGKALTVSGGQLVEVRSFVDGRERMHFPEPVGAVDVFHIGHPEPITLSRCFPDARVVNDRATFVPSIVNQWIVAMGTKAKEAPAAVRLGNGELDPMDFAAAYFHKRCKELKHVPKEGALRVEVRGRRGKKPKKVIFSSAGRIGHGTGIPAAVGAVMLAKGKIKKRGVVAPEECIEPNDFLFELFQRRNVAKLNGWIEG